MSTTQVVNQLGDLFGTPTAQGGDITVANLDTAMQGTPVDALDGTTVSLYVRIFDESSSMSGLSQIVIDAANVQTQALKDAKGVDEILMATWFFNSRPRMLHSYMKLDQVIQLSGVNYIPNGQTALYDTVLEAIRKTEEYVAILKQSGVQARVVIVIFSDGEDNVSRSSVSQVRLVVERLLREEIYTVAFVGCGYDRAAITAQEMGITNTLATGASPHDWRAALGETSKSVIRASQTVVGAGSQTFFS